MKTYYWLTLFVILLLNAHAQSDVATAVWMQQHVLIDGKGNEWEQPLNFYDDNTKLLFAIGNDSSNIYFCFESKDPLNQMKLMRAGMKITLTSKGKSKHNATIEFPLPPNGQVTENNDTWDYSMQNHDNENKNAPYTHQNHDTGFLRKNFIMNHLMMNVEGFTSVNGIIPVKNPSGISAAIDWDSASYLIYELAIPEKEFFGNDYTPKDVSNEIALSVEVNALHHASMQGSNGNNHDYHGGGQYGGGTHSGSFGGGGMHHGGSKQWSDADRASLDVKTSFKQKFVVSKGP